jgi:protein-S-isoprenylcysteine O-methyltransferase Ste14
MSTLTVIQISVFIIASVFLIIISRHSLRNPQHHGFYRFFTFEYIFILVILNAPFWFLDPFSLLQIISWLFLFLSLFVLTPGFYILKKKGNSRSRKLESANYKFEDTANLVDTGIYKYIRHPMYSSLILLAIGALLKNVTIIGVVLMILVIIFIIVTAKIEERENILFFGSSYSNYMKKSKMFFPYIY